MTTGVCLPVGGLSRTMMALHLTDGLAVCRSSDSGATVGQRQSNTASAGCWLVSPAQVRPSQLHHSMVHGSNSMAAVILKEKCEFFLWHLTVKDSGFLDYKPNKSDGLGSFLFLCCLDSAALSWNSNAPHHQLLVSPRYEREPLSGHLAE